MELINGPLSDSYDVVVAGSGAAALTAAAAARHAGATVAIIEKSSWLGGTSVVSGGMLWIPDNPSMRAQGLNDDLDDAVRYLEAVSRGRTPRHLLEAYVHSGREMLEFAESVAGLRTAALAAFPDYQHTLPGWRPGGRSIEPELFDLKGLGDSRKLLRPDPRLPFSMREYETWKAFTRFPWDELEARRREGWVAKGSALVAPLLGACERLGVTLVTETGLTGLDRAPGTSTGFVVRTDVGRDFVANRGVVIATGGFERNPEMLASFIGDRLLATCAPPTNTGDGIRAGQQLGAAVGNMSEAWWVPMVDVPGDTIDGAQSGTLLRFERNGPGTLMVGRHGRRFVNEAQNYNELTRVMHDYDPDVRGPRHLPAYLIFDERHLAQYGFLSHRAGQPTPSWLTRADSVEDLADALGLPSDVLTETVQRYNTFAARGEDPDFGRGASDYDRYWGDDQASHPNLAALETPPYYAAQVVPGALGTNGGLVTDEWARVRSAAGDPIPGLYAAGNTTAHLMGPGYAGAGSTLGPGMTMAYRAAQHLCS
ncbi:FAD-dependent oxidoreductase [Streptomyces sp. SID5914]|nr:FAD-dependent oxidoreductase [Streptomyces sp. SID5914]MZG13964.1 FAD-dependent oxidoreductase [Streptomyces sp. SID5914]